MEKQIEGFTVFKCPSIESVWITERGCLLRQNYMRKQILENYYNIKINSGCLFCKEGIERAKKNNFKLLNVKIKENKWKR